MSESKKLVILCVPHSALGHINATIGIVSILKRRGHTIVFALERSWAGKLDAQGFEEEIYDEEPDKDQKAGEKWSKLVVENARTYLLETIDQIEHAKNRTGINLAVYKYSNKRIAEIVATRKPDVVIQDSYFCYAALAKAHVPMVFLYSANPLKVLEDENLPPAHSGYGLDSDRAKWNDYCQRMHEVYKPMWNQFNEWVLSEGAPSLQYPKMQYVSTSLNLYMYPKSLASIYLARRASPSSWIAIDHCIRPVTESFVVPEKLKNLPGKLIFVSLGSMGSAVVAFMKPIVETLSKSRHRFIVCCGHNHREYSLADNMWGEPFLPQTAVLPHVDLVVTHGGNNSFIESLYFGKPLIVVPLFYDQYDNAQMAEESRIGLKFRLNSEPMENLSKKIDLVLNNEEILTNVQKISRELQESRSADAAASLVEAVARNPEMPAIVEALA